jgi:multiple antibiotic resistance protein
MMPEDPFVTVSVAQYTIKAIIALVAIMNPLYIMPAFLAATSDYSIEERQVLSFRAIKYAFLVLLFFMLAGEAILFAFGVSSGAFQLGGGILTLLTGIKMFFSPSLKADDRKKNLEVAEREQDDIALVPLAIPIIAGPGTITTVMTLKSIAPTWTYQIAVAFGIMFACSIVYLVFKFPRRITEKLGKLGLSATSKLMSIMLVAIAVQICSSGIEAMILSRLG